MAPSPMAEREAERGVLLLGLPSSEGLLLLCAGGGVFDLPSPSPCWELGEVVWGGWFSSGVEAFLDSTVGMAVVCWAVWT